MAAPKAILRVGPWDANKKKNAGVNETASGSAAGPQLRAGVKAKGKTAEVAVSESAGKTGPMKILGRLREADSSAVLSTERGRRFRAILLEEGMGNLTDCFYYTAEAIASCPPLFEGRRFFVDHPDAMEEKTRPERSVRDVAGWYENCGVEIGDGGQAQLCADVVTMNSPDIEPIRARLIECLNYQNKHPDQDLLGFSINASGDFTKMALQEFMKSAPIPPACLPKLIEAAALGIQMIHPVSKMNKATSCDLVTEAGAGGRISQLLEREKGTMAKQTEKKEADKKEAKQKEDGAGSPPAKDGSSDGAQGGADDTAADGDKEIIGAMMKKYLGDGFTEDDHQMAKEAMAHAQEVGKAHGWDESETEKAAGHFMQSHKMMQAKGAGSPPPPAAGAAKDPTQDAGAAPPPAPGKEAAGKEADTSKETADTEKGRGFHGSGFTPGKTPPAAQFESARGARGAAGPTSKETQLEATVARLTAELEAERLDKHMDSILKESRLPMTATKRFRESMKDVRSKKSVDEHFKIFKETWIAASGEADGLGGLMLSQERQAQGSGGKGGFDLADCKETD